MSTLLKDYYSPGLIRKLASSLRKADSRFNDAGFYKAVTGDGWKELELKQRMRRVSLCMNEHLSGDYKKKIASLKKAAPGFSGLFAMSFPDFVEVHGLDDPDFSLEALGFFTSFSTSEFAVRPFLIRYPDITLKKMLEWSSDKNHHIRRLSSEGCRPRLPWGIAIPFLKKDPTPILPILENLKSDPEDYVYRSVANNLNDISKDHPELMLSICKKWMGQHQNTDWLIKHACRGLLKKGHPDALSMFGHHQNAKALVSGLRFNKSNLRIGETIEFAFSLRNEDKKKQDFRIEYAIDYMKANGKHSRKVFLLKKTTLDPTQSIQLSSKQRLTDFTTRKHYPGVHHLHIVVNGKALCSKNFQLNK